MTHEDTSVRKPRSTSAMHGVILAAAALTSTAPEAAVERDPGFGMSEGVLETTLGGAPASFTDAVRLENGQLLVVGRTASESNGSTDMAVARLDADGSLDESFGTRNGYTPVAIDGGGDNDDFGLGIATLGSRIVIAGFAATASNEFDFAVARLDGDGTNPLTNHFDFHGNQDRAWDVAVDGMNRIYVVGESRDLDATPDATTAVAIRLDGNLEYDTSFGTSGIFEKTSDQNDEFATYLNVEIRTDTNHVLLAGRTDEINPLPDPILTQLRPANGSRDSDFGDPDSDPGDFIFDSGVLDLTPSALEIDSSGRPVVAGQLLDVSTAPVTEAAGVARVMANGMGLDTSFGTPGGVQGGTAVDIGPGVEYVYDIELDSRDRPVFVGLTETADDTSPFDSDLVIGRLGLDGLIDESFAEDGYEVIDQQDDFELLNGLVLVDDQTFVALGAYDTDVGNSQLTDTALALGFRIEGSGGVDGDSSSDDGADGGSSGGGGGPLGPMLLGALGWLTVRCRRCVAAV